MSDEAKAGRPAAIFAAEIRALDRGQPNFPLLFLMNRPHTASRIQLDGWIKSFRDLQQSFFFSKKIQLPAQYL